MIETAFADMTADSGKGNDDTGGSFGQDLVENAGKRPGGSTDGVIFVILNELANKFGFPASNVDWREVCAVWAGGCGFGSFTKWANFCCIFNNVIFTTVAQDAPQAPTTPTRVRGDEI